MSSCYKCHSTDNLSPKPLNGTRLYICRSCNSERMRKYYEEAKRKVIEHYGRKCNCCGEDQEMFLTIDHINNDGNTHRWKSGKRITGKHLYTKLVNSGFPPEYQVLCMNCNFGKLINNGTCPHNVV